MASLQQAIVVWSSKRELSRRWHTCVPSIHLLPHILYQVLDLPRGYSYNGGVSHYPDNAHERQWSVIMAAVNLRLAFLLTFILQYLSGMSMRILGHSFPRRLCQSPPFSKPSRGFGGTTLGTTDCSRVSKEADSFTFRPPNPEGENATIMHLTAKYGCRCRIIL